MDQLAAVRIFLRVAETGSFSAVAREFGVAQPTVSKQVAALEAHLGAQLLARTSRSLSLTEPGQQYYEATKALTAELDAAEASIGRRRASPSGVLRVTVPPAFGRQHVTPLLGGFLARYAELSVDLIVSERPIDLVHHGLDVGIRIGEPKASSLICRRIGSSPRAVMATKDYLERCGEPRAPSELADHYGVVLMLQSVPREWRFTGPAGVETVTPRARLRTNDPENIRQAVLSGLCLALAPKWLFANELASGEVRAVMADYQTRQIPINALYPPARHVPPKVRVFIDFLAKAFAGNPVLA